MKTSELTGAALNRMVAEAAGYSLNTLDLLYDIKSYAKFNPTEDWAQGGPIIERERLNLRASGAGDWVASTHDVQHPDRVIQYGPTPLTAAMRCFVSSRLGDEVEVPDELV